MTMLCLVHYLFELYVLTFCKKKKKKKNKMLYDLMELLLLFPFFFLVTYVENCGCCANISLYKVP